MTRRAPPRYEQANIRLSRDVMDVIEAVRFLEGKRTLADVLVPVVEEFARGRAKSRRVQRALKLRSVDDPGEGSVGTG